MVGIMHDIHIQIERMDKVTQGCSRLIGRCGLWAACTTSQAKDLPGRHCMRPACRLIYRQEIMKSEDPGDASPQDKAETRLRLPPAGHLRGKDRTGQHHHQATGGMVSTHLNPPPETNCRSCIIQMRLETCAGGQGAITTVGVDDGWSMSS